MAVHKVRMGDLERLQAALVELGKANFPIAMSYRMASMARAVEGELAIREKLRRDVVTRFGQTNEDGQVMLRGPNPITGQGGKGWDEGNQALRDIDGQEVEIQGDIDYQLLAKEFADDPPMNMGNILIGLFPVLINMDAAEGDVADAGHSHASANGKAPEERRQAKRARARQRT